MNVAWLSDGLSKHQNPGLNIQQHCVVEKAATVLADGGDAAE